MGIESLVGLGDQARIEASLTAAGLIARNQKHGVAMRIERERNTPNTAVDREAQLLHVGVTRALERVHPGTPRRRTESFDNHRLREEFILHRCRQGIEFRFELFD